MVMRILGDASVLLTSVGLVCTDEVHLLSLRRRGPEAVVSRLKLLHAPRRPSLALRFVAVLATATNIHELGKTPRELPRIEQQLSSSAPDPSRAGLLQTRYERLRCELHFEQSLNKHVAELIKECNDGLPSLVFYATKKGCDGASEALLASDLALEQFFSELETLAKFMDAKQAKFILRGICVHHSAIKAKQRAAIEYNFLKENIKILCTTSNLAQAVSLPARLSLVKSTFAYKEGKYCECDEVEMLQMIGRARRPQFDTCGVAVIVTSQESYAKWNDLSCGKQLVLSKMQGELVGQLNAEVALGTVCSADQADGWLDSTFWGVHAPFAKRTAAHAYVKSELDRLGSLFARKFMQIIPAVFQEHKKPLRDLSKHPNMKWSLKQCAINTKEKIFVLMQAAITGTRIDQLYSKHMPSAFKQELETQKLMSAKIGGTLSLAAKIFIENVPSRSIRDASTAGNSGVVRGVSDETPPVLYKLVRSLRNGICWDATAQLSHKDIESLDQLAGAEADALVACCHKSVNIEHLLGLRTTGAKLPRFVVTLHFKGDLVKTTLLSFDLQEEAANEAEAHYAQQNPKISYQLICYAEDGAIHMARRLVSARLRGPMDLFFRVQKAATITCQVLCKELVGLDITEELTLRDLTQAPATALPPTAMAHAQGLPAPPLASATHQPESKGPSSAVAASCLTSFISLVLLSLPLSLSFVFYLSPSFSLFSLLFSFFLCLSSSLPPAFFLPLPSFSFSSPLLSLPLSLLTLDRATFLQMATLRGALGGRDSLLNSSWRATARPAVGGGGHFGSCRSVEEFELLACIGEGTYGEVWKARDTRRGAIVALKQMRLLPKQSHLEGLPRGALREITLLKRMQHPNIIELIEVAVGPDISRARRPTPQELRDEGFLFCGNCYVYLVFEFCERDLAELVEERQVPFGPGEIKCIMRQLLLALCHLHLNKVLHRDVKLSNILLNAAGHIKLADFGLARLIRKPLGPATEGVVTLWYRAPELLLQMGVYGPAVDMWAAGCIFAALLSNSVFMGGVAAAAAQMRLITVMLGAPNPANWPGLTQLPGFKNFEFNYQAEGQLRRVFSRQSPACVDLLLGLLSLNPSKRLSARDALSHPYFTEAPAPSCVRLLSAAAQPQQHRAKRQCRSREHPLPAASASAAAEAEEDEALAWVESLCMQQEKAAAAANKPQDLLAS
ncbi:hypothetical protein Esti_003218 [Eimeria stiedai]